MRNEIGGGIAEVEILMAVLALAFLLGPMVGIFTTVILVALACCFTPTKGHAPLKGPKHCGPLVGELAMCMAIQEIVAGPALVKPAREPEPSPSPVLVEPSPTKAEVDAVCASIEAGAAV